MVFAQRFGSVSRGLLPATSYSEARRSRWGRVMPLRIAFVEWLEALSTGDAQWVSRRTPSYTVEWSEHDHQPRSSALKTDSFSPRTHLGLRTQKSDRTKSSLRS